MASPKHGISDHLLLESFERCHKHLLKIGFPAIDAYRSALAMTFMFTGEYSLDEAWQAADEIMDPYQTTNHEEPDA